MGRKGPSRPCLTGNWGLLVLPFIYLKLAYLSTRNHCTIPPHTHTHTVNGLRDVHFWALYCLNKSHLLDLPCNLYLLHISFLSFFDLSLWLIEIEINMLDEKLIKFLALQRIHQLFPSRVQASPGSVGTHPLTSGGHHTEGARAHTCHHTIRSPV